MTAEIIRLPVRRASAEPTQGTEKAILAVIEGELKRLDNNARSLFGGGLIIEIGRLYGRYKGRPPEPPDGAA